MAILKCLECGNNFNLPKNRISIAKFCSRKCYNKNKSYIVTDGIKINRLTSIKEVDSEIQYCRGVAGKIRKIECLCDCGNKVTTRLVNFINGITKSCGCLTIEQSEINISPKTHGLSNHSLYSVWKNMIDRCYNHKSEHYKYYGGRGVFICDEWRNDFMSFYNWAINNGWQKGLELDKDINGGLEYSPKKSIFVSKKVNLNNKITSKRIIINDNIYTPLEVSKIFNISVSYVYVKFKNQIVYLKDIL